MRRAITLDSDVAIQTRRLMSDRHISFNEAVNLAMRVGLNHFLNASQEGFIQRTFSLGFPTVNLDKATHFAAQLEDEETLRKVAMR